MNVPLEIKVIEKFVRKEKQSRYKQFVSSPKTRKKFIENLAHFRDFKRELFEEVSGFERNVVLQHLQTLKADITTCYVISEDKNIDQTEPHVDKAISYIGGDQATILVFGDAEMIYFEGEPPKNRYISKV